MNKRLQHIFTQASFEPQVELSERIWNTILARRTRQAKIRFYTTLSLSIVCFAALFPMIASTITDLRDSGVYEYISLGLSSGSAVATYWKEFALSIADAVPLTSILLSASLVFVFFMFAKKTLSEFGRQLQTV